MVTKNMHKNDKRRSCIVNLIRRSGETEIDIPPQCNHVSEQHAVFQRNHLEVHRLGHRPHLGENAMNVMSMIISRKDICVDLTKVSDHTTTKIQTTWPYWALKIITLINKYLPVGQQCHGESFLHSDDRLVSIKRQEILNIGQSEHQKRRCHHNLGDGHFDDTDQVRRKLQCRHILLKETIPPVKERTCKCGFKS